MDELKLSKEEKKIFKQMVKHKAYEDIFLYGYYMGRVRLANENIETLRASFKKAGII